MAVLHQTAERPLTGGILYRQYMLEKALGNYALSLDYYERFNHFADSVIELQSQMDLVKVEKRYEYAEVLNRNTILELKNSRLLVAGILLGVSILFVYYYFTKKLKEEREKQAKRPERERRGKEWWGGVKKKEKEKKKEMKKKK